MAELAEAVLGEAPLVEGPAGSGGTPHRPKKASPALIAATLVEQIGDGLTVLMTTSEARADEVGRALGAMTDADVEVLILPPWDCLPYDHASPSRESQGRRLAVLSRLGAEGGGRQVLVVSPEAAMLRLPPSEARSAVFEMTVGDALDRDALSAFARRTGYVIDDRIDEPGEIAILGEVVDVFHPPHGVPRGSLWPPA